MALHSKATLLSNLRSHFQWEPVHQARRGYHIELGPREKALLEEDAALKKFKSYKNSVKRVSKVGDALILVAAVACAYEIYAVATRNE